jgi:hypothetical protein
MSALDTLFDALTTTPTRARRIARDARLSKDEVREGLRQLQAVGLARSHDQKWTAVEVGHE